VTSPHRIGRGLALALLASAACGEAEQGIVATPGDVAIPVAYVECVGPADQHPELDALCGEFFYPMTWARTETGALEVVIGDEVASIEVLATLPEKYDPEQDFAKDVAYDASLVHGGQRDALTGNLVTETLVPSCEGGRFRAGGTLRWGDIDLDVSWEAYPATGCEGGTGGAGGFFGSGGSGGSGGAGGSGGGT
jgi:hypothetical protein